MLLVEPVVIKPNQKEYTKGDNNYYLVWCGISASHPQNESKRNRLLLQWLRPSEDSAMCPEEDRQYFLPNCLVPTCVFVSVSRGNTTTNTKTKTHNNTINSTPAEYF